MRALIDAHFAPDKPGIAAIVVRDGKTLLRTAAGLANVELGVAMQPNHVFRIASVTKQFTAAAILMLEARGALSVRDRITRFLPRYPTQGHKITIEHLLNHTSGIVSYTGMPEFESMMRQDMSLDELIATFKDKPMVFAPGERWQYNNSAYVLLGAIIEKVSGLSYEAFLTKHIFSRLGMAHTCYDNATRVIPNRAAGYSNTPAGVENAPYISMTLPHAAGSLLSTVDDLAAWDAALYTGKIVPRRALARAWTVSTLNTGAKRFYGYGWGVLPASDMTYIEHGGGIPGFSTNVMRIPERRVYVAALCNASNPPVSVQVLSHRLAMLALGIPTPEPKVVKVDKRALADCAGRYRFADDPDNPLVIEAKAGGLLCTYAPGQPPVALPPLSDSEYQWPDSLMRLRFVRGATDAIERVQMVDRGVVVDSGVRLKDKPARRR